MSGRTADAIVIGGGVIGLSIAFQLAKQRLGNVVVVERNYVCSGTTGQSGAIIRQHYSNDFTASMARDSLNIFRNWRDEVGGDVHFEQTGVLILTGAEYEPAFEQNVALHQSLGIDSRQIDLAELQEIEPRISTDGLSSACWEATAGIVDPVATVHALAMAFQREGGILREQTEVSEILRDGDHVAGVRLSDGAEIAAPVVVNAGNLWGARLLMGFPYELPLFASRHPMAWLRRPDDFGPSHPVVLDLQTMGYLIPRGGATLSGSLLTHAHDQPVDPDGYEKGVSNEEIRRFFASAAGRVPALGRSVVQGGWAGIYDESPDSHPVLDELPGVEGLFLALGFSGHGFKLSPMVGRWMANMIAGGRVAAPELWPFRATRWIENEPIVARSGVGVLS
jgi:sarcosine oxidase subunit beta